MGHVIPDMNFRVWKALDLFLKRYYEPGWWFGAFFYLSIQLGIS